jgi:hypothetical protein
MDLDAFEKELRKELSLINFVIDIEFKQRTPISLSGIVRIQKDYFLSIFCIVAFNIMSFSLIYRKSRIWAIDRDNRIGWHIHPLNNSENHEILTEQTIKNIISDLNILLHKLIIENK